MVEPKDIYVVIGHEAEHGARRAAAHGRAVCRAGGAARDGARDPDGASRRWRQYENLIVLSGDAPMITTETILQLRDFHLEQQAAMTMLTTRPAGPDGIWTRDPQERGRAGSHGHCGAEGAEAGAALCAEINSGIYAFRAEPLFKHIGQLSTDNAHGEYYLTDMAALLVKAKERVVALESGGCRMRCWARTPLRR